MKKIKFIFVFLISILLIPSALADSLSYSAAIHYRNWQFELKNIILTEAASAPKSEVGEYTAKIISFKNDVLFETKFNINLVKFYGLPVSKETAILPPEELAETTIDLLLPYYPNAKTLQILKNDAVLLEADLSNFATCNENNVCDKLETIETCPKDCTCGNRVCDGNENYVSCSTDCASGEKDDYCDRVFDNKCDPDCSEKEDFDCGKEKTGSPIAISIYIISGIIVAAIIFFVYKKSVKK